MGAAAAIAYADQIVPDADTVTAGDQSNQTLSATKGATLTPQTSFTLRCNGNNHVDNGETVSLTFLAVGGSGSSIPAGVGASLSATGASLGPVSSAWPDDGTGCSTPTPQTLGDNGNSVVTIGAPNALGGPYAYTVKWSQSNLDDLSGNGPQVTYNVNVNPRPPSNFNATANGNSEIDLSWTASPDAADITDYKIVRTKTSGGATTTLTAAKTATTLNDTGLADSSEYCYTIRARYNDGTTDFFSTSVGPACATTATAVADADSDGIPDSADNCPNDPNTDQANRDGDGFGDVCDDNSFAPALGTAAADQSGNEGSALTTSGSFTDGDGNSTLTISKMSGNGTVTDNGDGTWSWSYTPTDNGGASVTVKASDGEHADATDTFNWSAANVPPTATLGNNGPKGEGTAATVSFSAQSDASSDDTAAGFHYAYSCTNGSLASATYDNSGTSDSTSCTYFDNGTYTVKARIIDKDDGYTEYTTDVSVTNVAPAITSAAFTSPASCGANNATLHVVFGDPGTLDTWTAKVDWNNDGDYADAGEDIGSVTSPFDASHTFNGGVHAVKVQVTDDDGDSSNQPTASVTVNYNLSSILQPINDTGHGQNPSVFKYGSTIPVKVEVTDCDGSHPTNLVLYVKYTKTSGATPPGDTEVVPTSQADSGNQMRYSDPLYVLQLSSKAITNDSSSGYTLFVNIQSTNQSTQANIGFK